MAVQGVNQQPARVPPSALGFWLAALAAAVLSLAAALAVVLWGGSADAPYVGPDGDLAARKARVSFYEGRAAADPLDYISLNILAGEYLQRGRETGDVADLERADYAATKSLEILPGDNYGGYVGLASVRLVQHQWSAALDLARQAIALKPAGPAGYGVLGDAFTGLGRYDEAGRAYEKMVRLDAALPALSRLAMLAFLRGDQLNAIDFWKQALSKSAGLPVENVAWAHSQLAGIYFAYGDLGEAAKEHQRSLDLFPRYVPALAGLGSVRAAQGRWDESSEFYSRAVARLPQPQYVTSLGDVYAAAGRPDDAEAQYALVEAIDKLYQAAGINTDLQLALFYADHDRNLDRAVTLARNAYAEAPSVQAAGVYAWVLYKTGDFDAAESKIREALRFGTPDASLHYYAAKINVDFGKGDQARDHIERVFSLNRHFSVRNGPDARNLLNELRESR